MPVANKRDGFHRASYAGFFVCFPGGGIGVRCILVHSTFWKSPMAVPGAHQKELRFTVAYPIANRSHVNALEIRW